MKISNAIFYIIITITATGFIFRLQDLLGGASFLFIGTILTFAFFLLRLAYNLSKKSLTKKTTILHILIILMSVILHSKYFYHRFGDIPGLIIIPTFLGYTLFFLIKTKPKDKKAIVATIVYFIFTIPLFGFEFDKAPRRFIPKEWYNRYDVSKGQSISLPYPFKHDSAKELYEQAHRFKDKGEYHEARKIYEKARVIEPDNPKILFDLSDCYARINQLEYAISLLDTAIIIDDSFAPFYINRGVLYYKLIKNTEAIQDYNRAIELDSTQSAAYANLALVYYYEKRFDEACHSLQKAESLGFMVAEYRMLKKINEKYCK